MQEPPPVVGAPSELADAHEMPGCLRQAVLLVFGLPVYLLRELPTLPLDGLIWAHEKGGWRGAGLYLMVLLTGVGMACWGLVSAVL